MSESSSVFSESNMIIVILAVSMILTGIVVISHFLVLDSHLEQVIENGTSHNVTTVSLSINEDLWNKLEPNNLLLGILTSASAIVAISFTVIQMLTTDFEKKYGGYAKSFLTVKPNSPFISLILVIAGSSIMLFIQHSIEPVISLLLILALLEGFIFSLILYVKNYYDIFHLMNPFTYVGKITEQVKQNMREPEENE